MSYNKIRRIGDLAPDPRGSRPDATAQDHHPLSACSSIWSQAARRAKRAAAVGGLAAVVAAAAVTPAHAASLVPSPNAPHTPGMVKPSPVAPRPQVAPAVAKPNIPLRTSTAGWAASLMASPFILWPTQSTTLIATANGDVGPTPYYLGIYDPLTLTWLAECGSGQVCAVSGVTEPTPNYHVFMAVVGPWHTLPNNGALASAQQSVYWQGVTLSLTANSTTLLPYGPSILTVATSAGFGPSPFVTAIYDTTTGARLQVCAVGPTCSVMVMQAPGTHRYIAYVGIMSLTLPPALPPPSVQETSASVYVTWSPTPIAVSLFANPAGTTSITTVTAKTTVDVGPTPYYIEIFNENGTLLSRCGSGTTCSFTYAPPSYPGADLVAFVSSASTSLPPANTQGSSNVVHVNS